MCQPAVWFPVRLQELARPDGSPTDVDREFVVMYWVAHERMTFYAGLRTSFPYHLSKSVQGVLRPTQCTTDPFQ